MSFDGAWIDTAGTTNFNKAAAKTVIDDVNGTPASVTTAVAAISNGTLPGLVPGLAQINAVASKQAAVTAFEKATAVANPTFDTLKADGTTAGQDGSVSIAELNAAKALATTAHNNAVGAGVTTATATADLKNLTDVTVAAKEAAVKASSATAVANLDAALANKAAVEGTLADQNAVLAAKAGAQAAFASAFAAQPAGPSAVTVGTLDSKTLAAADITDATGTGATSLYAALTSTTLSSTERAALVAEVNKVGPTGVALVAAADKEIAVAKAGTALAAAKTAVNGTGTTGTDYAKAVTDQKTKADAVAKAVAADTQIAAIKVISDAHDVLDTAVTTASNAVGALNSTKIAISDISGAAAGSTITTATAAKSDVFYFAAKAVTATDVTIGTAGGTDNFGAGDSIVVGSGYTFNAGALSTGNNSVAEMFLVQGANGVQIVLENTVFGSGTVAAPGATGVITPSINDSVSVITLTGVSIDHVAVNNGVVSYV